MVEIIPKKVAPLSRWVNILFYFSLALLVFCIADFFILGNSIKKSQKALTNLEDSLLSGKTSERISLEKEILKYQKKTEDFSKIIGGHLETLKVFDLLQKNCHPKVWFSSFSLDSKERQVDLSGETQSFESLGQQLLIFQGEDSVESVNLEKVSISKEGKIGFSLSLSLIPNFLNVQ
ncbi:MAG: hypothetical protein COS26_00330 [Candidatus Nealsonbacteria bacterium CG02_land_8_20_14_3_00_40_11]|uniref:PilN domain-containing protein n=2 Tax=Candidatus Nealsoniibacteriota TaxID=1817911 RepID=A0A2M7D8N9_9BACT|nr:MAG: hypothetical protein COS26_00330 [Candidatus Nealsonbacteria bacterium CG02_land_8_20_14_3_00_40_11]